MNKQLDLQIEDWESADLESLSTLALRTAALISAVPDVPESILNTLAALESGDAGPKSPHVYRIVKFLRECARQDA